MAISGGPDIVEDGLVLHLDAAEPLCFRGEPTTNLASYTNGNASRGSWPYGVYTHSIETTGEFAGWEKIVATSVGSATSNYIVHIGQFFPTSGVQYTGSIEFYSPYNNLMFEITGGQGIGSATRIGSSNKYYRTFATSISTNMAWYLRTIASTPANTAITNGVIYYRRAQFEQKPYYTDFTIGTRGSTVATGGGLLDLTNNGNNGEINRTSVPSAAFYSGNNRGSFVFNGSNDYISTGKVLVPRTGEFHIEGWCYLNQTNVISMFVTQYFNSGDSGRFQCFFFSDGSIRMHDGIGVMTGNTPTYLANEWFYVAFQRDSNNFCNIFVNGIKATTGDTKTSTLENTNTIIGSRGSNTDNTFYNGKMAHVRIYNRALTQEQILQNYHATKGRFGL